MQVNVFKGVQEYQITEECMKCTYVCLCKVVLKTNIVIIGVSGITSNLPGCIRPSVAKATHLELTNASHEIKCILYVALKLAVGFVYLTHSVIFQRSCIIRYVNSI